MAKSNIVKSLKRWVVLLIAFMLVISQTPITFGAIDEEFTANDITYRITSEGETNEVSVKKYNYDSDAANNDAVRVDVSIPATVTNPANDVEYDVTAIDNDAFALKAGYYSYNYALQSVAMANSIKSIGENAFRFCANLNSITFSDSLTTIGTNAFEETALSTLLLPASLETLGDGAFADCFLLTEVTIPDTTKLTTIGAEMFSGCENLSTLNLPATSNSLSSFGESAFSNCAFTSFVVPDYITDLGESAFSGNSYLTSFTLGLGITTIPDSAFESTGLTSLPDLKNVTYISDYAFYNSNIVSLTLSSDIRYNHSAFGWITTLESVFLEENFSGYLSGIFSGSGNIRHENYESGMITNLYFNNTKEEVETDGIASSAGITFEDDIFTDLTNISHNSVGFVGGANIKYIHYLYEATFKSEDGLTIYDTDRYYAGASLTAPTPTLSTGLTLEGWYLEGDATETLIDFDSYTMPEDHVVFIAKISGTIAPPIVVQTVTLTVVDGEGDGNYTPGTNVNVTFTGPAPAGLEFAGWDTNGDGTIDVTAENFTYTMPGHNVTITPVYQPAPNTDEEEETVTLTVVDGNGDGEYTPGDTANVTFTGPTPDGEEFAGWDTNGDGNVDVTDEDFTFTMPDQDTIIVPIYRPTGADDTEGTDEDDTTVTLTVVDGDGDGEYKPGDKADVTFTGPTPDGEEFLGWDTDGDGKVDVTDEDFEFTMPDENVTITPVYGDKTPDIGDNGDVTITPPGGGDGDIGGVDVGGKELGDDDYTVNEDGSITINPDVFKDLPDGEHTINIKTNAGISSYTVIVENGVPLASGAGAAWSLFDLLMTILAVFIAIYFIVIATNKKKEETEQGVYEEKRKRKVAMLFTALISLFTIVLLIITQDFTQPMTFFDRWSIVFAVAVLVDLIALALFKRKSVEDDEKPNYAN